jgi:hypothetical protein
VTWPILIRIQRIVVDMMENEKTAYWRQQADGFLANGLSVKNNCAQEGVTVATLQYWHKRFAGTPVR